MRQQAYNTQIRRGWLAGLALLAMAVLASTAWWSGGARALFRPDLPHELWWYWDRPAASLPTPPPGIGAAVVTTQVYFSGSLSARQPRRSALPLAARVFAIPVVHVEVDPARPFAGSAAQREVLQSAVLDLLRERRPAWVQLDFEARPSQREFWLASVRGLRARLPPEVGLSVTALASWCYGDDWLAAAPVDEVVPMYFRLGRDRPEYVARSRSDAPAEICRHAHGLADDEPSWPVTLPGRRYLFLGARREPRTAFLP